MKNYCPQLTDTNRFDLVHVDCDWFESARAVFQYLRQRLGERAVIQIDDYYLLARRQKSHR